MWDLPWLESLPDFEMNVLCFLHQLLHMSLKRSKVNSSEEHALEMLDPFVQLLIDCLKSMDVKVQLWAGVCLFCLFY